MIFEIIYLFVAILLIVIGTSYILIILNCKRKAIVETTLSNGEKVKCEFAQAPSPNPWPIIGNLDIIGRFANPFKGFQTLAEKYGNIYSLSFGHTRCLVVNNLELIREILNKNGKFFGGRPDFLRYHKLFGGDRNNSLALCDWSHLQQKRRNLARRHCSPRESSSYFTKMSCIGCDEIGILMERLQNVTVSGQPIDLKPILNAACANMFSQYMCSIRFDYEDNEFQQIVHFFDEIFWEINQGHPLDFLPWLSPFYTKHTTRIAYWSTTIRKFILERIIDQRQLDIDLDEPDTDFTDALLKSLIENENMCRNTIIFMLEDFIGGHSAVGNLIMLALTYIAKDPIIARNIQNEIDAISNNGERSITLEDMEEMSYTMATIYEVLRYSSSPIVPHVASEDSVVSGFGVTKGTIVFINNYVLNMSQEYWRNPDQFCPGRFLEEKCKNNSKKSLTSDKRKISEGSDSGIDFGQENEFVSYLKNPNMTADTGNNEIRQPFKFQLKKNLPHFLPFSIGKRTCIGQNLVRGFGFILLANILLRYNVSSPDLSHMNINPASLALPAKCFELILTTRK
ncbi:cytochrome P450 307a1 [Drosophila grimshawi]|uniref:GH21174 n=1 Tax=Drosophila grimshawi TaxID=7222 RepID=B4JRP7_DROGR|nr:cytochrome P450 307a1 [Drosophila grimshawi]EDV94437.1 GH21174 [Drosophila grimshawi]